MLLRGLCRAIIVLGSFATLIGPVQAGGIASYATVGVGAFDILDGDALAADAFVSYRFADRLFDESSGPFFRGIGPMVGIKANTDGGLAGYGSLFLDLRPSERWVLWPSAGLAGYRQGDSRDLGGTFVFHLEATIGYRIAERHMLGISYQHLSNAGIQPINPGTDSLFLSYTFVFP